MSSIARSALERRLAGRSDDAAAAEMGETYLLNLFWALSAKTADRLGLLLLFTRIAVVRVDTWDRVGVRRDHEAGVRRDTIRLTRSQCFGCETAAVALYFHHILEIQHGGSNAIRNQVPLCFECHRYLHPWLEAPSTRQGFTKISEIAPSVVALVVPGHGR